MGYIEIIQAIPISLIANLFLFFFLMAALKFNPAKPTLKDLIGWIKLKTYKNASIHRMISADGCENEIILSKVTENISHKFLEKTKTYIMNPLLTTRRNQVPVYTHLESNSLGVNFFKNKEHEMLNSEIYENTITAAKATADFDFFNKLWGYRHAIKFIMVIVHITYLVINNIWINTWPC